MGPVRRSLLLPGLLALVGVLAAGCGWNDDVDSRAATQGVPATRADVEARDWVLVPDDSSIGPVGDTAVTLSVDGDRVSGQAPCNTYTGSFSLERDGSVDIDRLALTRKACPGPADTAETAFVEALEAADHVTVTVDEEGRDDHDRLVLTGPGGVRLAFRSYDAADLLAGTWTITGVATGDAVASVVAGTEPTVAFRDGGDLRVITGCNDGGGGWELDGHDLSIGPLVHTMKACSDPEGVMEQETAIYEALDSAARVEIAPGSLTILDDAGHIALTATS